MVPVKKKSKSRTRTRRAHHALPAANLVACPKCGSAKRPHCACDNCGYVSGQVALPLKEAEA
jgi:large subunit ribosomal protein L32